MNHPSESLSELVDGTLGADARTAVEAHLAACATCRSDLAAAQAGRDALRRLAPAAPPAGLSQRIVQAAGRGDDGAATGAPRWYRWAGVAAAAALIVVIATSLPEIGDGGAEQATVSGAEGAAVDAGSDLAGGAEALANVPLQRSDQDFRSADLERLASSAAGTLSSGGAAAAPGPYVPESEQDQAASCIANAFGDQVSGRLVRLIRARFEGAPAYLAVYLEGPGAGQEPDAAVVWVASVDGCDVLSFAMARR